MTLVDTYTTNYGFIKSYFDKVTWHNDINGNFDAIDAVLAASASTAFINGTWATATAYTVGQRIYDRVTPNIYICNTAHTSGTTFAADRATYPTRWTVVTTGIVFRGAWITATAYVVGDLVQSSGSVYYCSIAHTATAFATDLAAVKWVLFASAGAAGPGTGDVVGPAGATDLRVAVFDGVTGKLIKDGGILLAALATLAAPTFTGVPAAPTATPGTNTTQVATTAFVKAAVDALVAAAPGTLDTLNELAAALGNDANFATTMTNALALKSPIASPTFTGVPAAPTAAGGTNTTQLATTAFVATAVSGVSKKKVLTFGPSDNEPPASNYAVYGVRNNHPYLAFDTTTQWTAQFSGVLPTDYAGNGLTCTVYVAAETAITGTIGFDAAIERIDASVLDIDADSYATAKTITATTVPGTSGMILALSCTFSSGAEMDSLAAGEAFRLRIRRDVANDTAAGNAQVIAATIRET